MERPWLGVVGPVSSNNVSHLSFLSAFHCTGLNSQTRTLYKMGKRRMPYWVLSVHDLRRKDKALFHRSLLPLPPLQTKLDHIKPNQTFFFGSMGFPGSSAGKESICNAGDPSSIPGLGRCPEEGIGHPLQYFWASLVAQLVKNLPALQKTWVRSLSQKDPLEEGMATHSSFLAWRKPPWTEVPGQLQSMGSQRVRHD